MPLSPPAERDEIHQRDIVCRGYRRADGLWDVEARLTDRKTYGFDNHDRGRIEAGEPVHDMAVRLTVDGAMTVRAVEVAIDAGPYGICNAIAPAFQDIVGLTIGPGFLREVRRRHGGTKGCTHVVELFAPLATTAWQTLVRARAEGAEAGKRPPLLDSCHAQAADGPVAKRRWPDFYTGD